MFSENNRTRENILATYFTINDDDKTGIEKKTKLAFNGIPKQYISYNGDASKQNELLMIKPTYLGFAVLELKKLLLYETYYDELQHYVGEKIILLPCMDTDSLVSSINTNDNVKDSQNLKDLFDLPI